MFPLPLFPNSTRIYSAFSFAQEARKHMETHSHDGCALWGHVVSHHCFTSSRKNRKCQRWLSLNRPSIRPRAGRPALNPHHWLKQAPIKPFFIWIVHFTVAITWYMYVWVSGFVPSSQHTDIQLCRVKLWGLIFTRQFKSHQEINTKKLDDKRAGLFHPKKPPTLNLLSGKI